MVFEPGQPYELTDQEVAGLRPEIECGLLVPWSANPDDHRSRQRPPRDVPLEQPIETGEDAVSEFEESEEFDESEALLVK